MAKSKSSNPEIQKSGIDLEQLLRIEQLETLRDQCHYLMTSKNPQITVHIDGKQITLRGHDARAFGCGMQVILKEIGYPAVDPWMEN